MMAKRIIVCIMCAIIGLTAWTMAMEKQPATKTGKAQLRVGTFDSRAVALAYGRSDASDRYMKELRAEYEKAKAAGDEKRVKEVEAKGKARQELLHKQIKSTWHVDNILEQIKEKIPDIARQADVDVIVSKWDIVYQRSGVEFIDVTDLMVKQFDADERTLELVKELKKQYPFPLEELNKH